MICKHNYIQLLNKKGKPYTEKDMHGVTRHKLFCSKCGETKLIV